MSILLFSYIRVLTMKTFLKIMKALSDPNRVKIIKMLQHKMMCVCELQAALKLAQPTVSRHLKMLEDTGLIRYQKEGLWVNCHLAQEPAHRRPRRCFTGFPGHCPGRTGETPVPLFSYKRLKADS